MCKLSRYLLTVICNNKLISLQSLGNHEFDEAVAGLIPFIKNITTPVLAANLILDKVPDLKQEANLKPSIVIEKDGVKIGIIGYLTPDTKILAPKNLVKYEDEVIALRREVANLKAQGVNILIALGHSGYLKDCEIARDVEDIDLVIGGHSNTFLSNDDNTTERPEVPHGPYPVMIKQASGRMVPVVQAYAFTKYMGRIHLIFNSNGEIISLDGDPMLLNQTVHRDADTLAIVKKYKSKVDVIRNEVVGTSKVMLDGDCRLKECNMGNLITDAVLNYSKEHDACVDIAIIQGGRIRASIDQLRKPFEVTKGDWLTVLPFSDTLAILTMNGSVLLKALEHSVSTWRKIDSKGQFLQVAGMQVIYDLSKPPGQRIVKALAARDCGRTPLDDIHEKFEYKVIMPFFLAEGGDGYDIFTKIPYESVMYNEIECVIDYYKVKGDIDAQISDRIVFVDENNIESYDVTNEVNEALTSSSGIRLIKNINLLLLFSLYILLS